MTMTKSSFIAHRCCSCHIGDGGLSANSNANLHWVRKTLEDVEHKHKTQPMSYTPAVDDLNNLVQRDPTLRMLATAMLDEVPDREPYVNDPRGTTPQIRNWDQLLRTLSHIMTEVAPSWVKSDYEVGMLACPFNAILNWPMATQSGHAFFLHPQVNAKFKVILETWRKDFLETSASQYVVTTDKDGWLGEDARTIIEAVTNITGTNLRFEELFECDPEGDPEHWGFRSWDDFFIRRFRDINLVRPVAYENDPKWIVSACESRPYALQSNVQEVDTFWLKGQPYSLSDMLDHKEWASQFAGGTVYQAYLSSTTYHRWCSPVQGQVIETQMVAGTYFSEPLINGFGGPNGPDPSGPSRSQGYISHVATRAFFIIDAGPDVGLVAVIFVGMVEVSTCDILEKFQNIEGPVNVMKGEELGMFHHGGSSYCLLFQKHVKLAWVGEGLASINKKNLPVRGALAYAHRSEHE